MKPPMKFACQSVLFGITNEKRKFWTSVAGVKSSVFIQIR